MTRPDTGLPLTGGQRQWLHHLRACEAKGQTTVAYAKAHGLKVSALSSARKTLVEMGVLPRPAVHRCQRAHVLCREKVRGTSLSPDLPAQKSGVFPVPLPLRIVKPTNLSSKSVVQQQFSLWLLIECYESYPCHF